MTIAVAAHSSALPFTRTPRAVLALEDGSIFRGSSIGAAGYGLGEVVFNTAMTGYQEILTDPSYCGQIVTLTYPHIGNTGINVEDVESGRIRAAGLVIKDLPAVMSNFRATQSLSDYLASQGVVGIAGIDTRRLTRILRDKGAQSGAIVTDTVGGTGDHADRAMEIARSCPGLAGMDLAKVVSTAEPYEWSETEWALGATADGRGSYGHRTRDRFHVVALDFGIKRNILRKLASRGCRITVLPAHSSAEDALALAPDGIFLSNGPGDPEPCDYAVTAVSQIVESGLPTFGICLGHQLMGLAAGARTLKMRFGHHGANHPVLDLDTGRVMITSQNHGFRVDADSLPANCRVTHVSLFDGTLQGFARTDRPAFFLQGHPEASPGPHDMAGLFDRFISLIEEAARAKA
jgi:carbamoyl-phosphate synthase small subunit